ncbi:MAG: hypothetical protein JG782_993 [Anaerophaga sp.]|nr:hypothetical protein [Anaerophaga sp.]MDN5290107.1 hypothetical protein [Anaerophaga sp.]
MKIIEKTQKERFLELVLNKGYTPPDAYKELLKQAEIPLFFDSADEVIQVAGIQTTPKELSDAGIPVFPK